MRLYRHDMIIFFLTIVIYFGCFDWEGYTLSQQYERFQNSKILIQDEQPEQWEKIYMLYHNSPQMLCRLIDWCEDRKIALEQTHRLERELMRNYSSFGTNAQRDIFATLERWKSFDRRYEKWIVEQGLLYFPNNIYFISRKYLLDYESSLPAELTSQERALTLSFLQKMLCSEEDSLQCQL